MMKVIGITGGSGCGKTTALQVLSQMGARIIDCDAVYHELLQTNTAMCQEIAEAFPGCLEDGKLNRKKLGSLVFADPAGLQRLNEITHPYVFQAVQEALEQAHRDGCWAAAIDAIALHESGLGLMCHTTIAVTAPRADRIRRLMQRDGISEAYACARIDAQHSDEEFSAMCRHTLHNDGSDPQAFAQRCQTLFSQIRQERSFHCERE